MSPVNSVDSLEDYFTIEENILKGVKKEYSTNINETGQFILDTFDEEPDHVPQIDSKTGRKTTFREMKDNSIRCALWLRKLGIGNNDVVSVCTHNHSDAYIPLIATFLVGATFNPWYHEITLESAQRWIQLTNPKVIFVVKSIMSVIQEAVNLQKSSAKLVLFEDNHLTPSLKYIMKMQTDDEVKFFKPTSIEDPQQIAIILFSSGSSGLPKPVAHSYKTIFGNIASFYLVSIKNCVCMFYSCLAWVSGTLMSLQAILLKYTWIITTDFDVDEACKIIEKYKVNWAFFSPTMMNHFYKTKALKNYTLSSLKFINTGSSKLSADLIESISEMLANDVIMDHNYGMTETAGLVSGHLGQDRNFSSVGYILPNIEMKFVDDDNVALGPEKIGEICIRSSQQMMLGYYKNPEATRKAIDNEGWYRTGDSGYYNNRGEIFIAGRLKETMKFRGHQISPFEIEDLLIRHPGVQEAVVVPILHELDGEHPLAFVKKTPSSQVTAEELIELSASLGDHKKIRAGIIFVENLERTISGKIIRKKVKEMAEKLLNSGS